MRAHGTRACFVHGPNPGTGAGCRCEPCKEANRAYARKMYRAKHRPDEAWEPYVDCGEARDHLAWLRTVGVGRRTVSQRSGVAVSSIQRIANGTRTKARKDTVDRILAVGKSAAHGSALVDAGPTWRRVDDLLAHGWTKKRIAQNLTGDPRTVALQIGRTKVTAETAARIRAIHETALRPVLRDREINAAARRKYREAA